KFIEMRGADGGPWRRICALPALWVGLLYDDAALDAADALTRNWSHEAVLALRNDVPTQGLDATIGGQTVLSIAGEVLKIARDGLAARNNLNAEGVDETHFLAPLEEVIARGTTSAEQMLIAYNSVWDGDIERVFLEHAY
ncbi:MAG: glutamate--cysteine ligase, partial [Pseudomonadota bacterium]